MPVTIRATGLLKRFVAPDTVLENTHTVGEAVTQLALPEDIGLVMLVNGHTAHWHTVLRDGDTLQLIPVISGG
ncbi:MAG TPA: MoaD/ThiS family protein [Caldilineae bacterium]|nr:MoaD/ThiS family protein [Caldilineae bacterium]